jgi:hypothetical protein
LIRDIGAAGEVLLEVLDVVASLSEAVAGMLSLLGIGSARSRRRLSVLLVDLGLTFSFTDVDVEGMFEPLLLLVDVFSFLALFLLRTLFLPMMREEMLLL